ncbi:MAG: hypothetical protein HY331_15235 [Chloroflexi bacterium]|nr:hypothetical protein [Chloroflexota bacterium]
MLDRRLSAGWTRRAVSRRHFISTLTIGAGLGLLAACAPAASPAAAPARPTEPPRPAQQPTSAAAPAAAAPTAAPAPTTAPAATAAPAPTTAPAATAAPAAVKRGGKLIVGTDVNPVGLDPAIAVAFSSVAIYEQLYMSLGTLEYKTNKVLPDLAESWRAVDARTYEFKLRPGVKFHSGREVTAEDVKFSFDRVMDPKVTVPLRSYLGPIEKTEAVDKATARIVMKTPFAPLLSVVADRRPCAIVDREIVEKKGDLQNTDGGSGPFKLVEYTPDVKVVMERHGDYYEKGKPYLDQIEFRIMPDESSRLAAIRSGDIDMTVLKDPKNARLLKNEKNINLNDLPSYWRSGTPLNTKRPPLNDVRVRQAISYAIDRQEIINTVLLGEGVVSGPIPPAEAEWALPITRENFPTYFTDLDKSKALLKEAGVSSLKLTFNASPAYATDIPTAQVVQSQLKRVGIDIEIKQYEWAAFLKAQADGDFDLNVGFHTNRPDPDSYLGFAPTNGAFNYGKYSSPKMDELMEKARTTTELAERKKLYADIQRLYALELPWLFYYVIKSFDPARAHVKGYTPMASSYRLALKETWVEK